MLACASQLLLPRQAGREVTRARPSSPRRHLLAARALDAWTPPRRTPQPLDMPFPLSLSLRRSPSWPTLLLPHRRRNRAPRRPRAASSCPRAPPSSITSSGSSPERSLTPEMLHRARPQVRPPEIPFAAPAASAHPRPLRLPRRDPRELSHLPTLSVLSLEPRSDCM